MPSDTSHGVALRICVLISACSVWTPCLAEPEKACDLSSGGGVLGAVGYDPRLNRRTDKPCRRIMIPEQDNEKCHGLKNGESGRPHEYIVKELNQAKATGEKTERYATLEVRAVKYVPRPVGVVGHVDLYDDHFHFIHKRDLYIISQILKANTIRIDPWLNDNEHKGFFALCKEFGLMVIPTFDMSYFFRTQEWREASFSHLRETALMHFDEFMKNVRREEPVLMWSVNHGLFLNETTENGFLSRDATNPHRDRYFELLKAFRNVHYAYEWNKGLVKNAYARPLALPLLLDSKKSQDNVGWFLAFAENDWTRWPPTTPEGLEKDPIGAEELKKAGVFDVWLVETMPPTQHENIGDVVESLLLFNDSVLSEIKDKPPAAKQYPDCNGGEPFCNYATKKAVLLQYGFSALTEDPSKQMRLELMIDRQQTYLRDVWSVVRDKESHEGNGKQAEKLSALLKMSCVGGAVIDEWADDWDRCATMGYDSQAFIQNKGGMCDEVKPGKLVHVEWFGLSAQYSFFGHHCIDPRFRSDDNPNAIFRFEKFTSFSDADLAKEQEHWQNVAACALMIPDLRILIQIIVLTALIIFISLFRIRKLRLNRGFELEEPETDQHQGEGRRSLGAMGRRSVSPHMPLMGITESVQVRVQTSVEVPAECRPQANMLKLEYDDRWEEKLEAWKIKKGIKGDSIATVVDRKGHTFENVNEMELMSPAPERFPLTFTFEDKNKAFPLKDFQLGLLAYSVNDAKGRGRFTNAQALMHLKSHTRIQVKRLRHQLQCEALAVQALEAKPELATCYADAMVNIHARALEGYMTWLESEARCPQLLKTMLGEDRERQAWELWIEAILLRILESMAEHVLHSPELIGALFHQIRWDKAAHVTLHYDEKWQRRLVSWMLVKDIKSMTVTDKDGAEVDEPWKEDGDKPQRDRFPLTCVCDDGVQEVTGMSSADAILDPEDDARSFSTSGSYARPEGSRIVSQPEDKPMFTIDYKVLHSGIEELKTNGNPYAGGVNFDDINDCGFRKRFKIEKTYRESASVLVWIDILSNFQPVFTVKAWVLMLAWYSYLGGDRRNGTFFRPTFQRERCIQVFAIVDSVGSFSWEVLIFVHGLLQKRRTWIYPARWFARRLLTMIVTGAGAIMCIGQCVRTLKTLDQHTREEEIIKKGYDPETLNSLYLCTGYFAIRLIVFLMLNRFLSRAIPYLPGKPQGRKGSTSMGLEVENPLTASFQVLTPGGMPGSTRGSGASSSRGSHSKTSSSVGRLRKLSSGRGRRSDTSDDGLANLSRRSSGGQPLLSMYSEREEAHLNPESEEARDSQREEQKRKLAQKTSPWLGPTAAWGTMLACAFYFEMRFIVPLCAGFDWEQFCGSRCRSRRTFSHNLSFFGSDCLACNGTLVAVWMLVTLTGIIDIYYIFYFGTAIFGYAMGEWRGLRNVLSTALRHLDLDVTSAGSPESRNRVKKKRRMKLTMTDGEAMKYVFGASWRMIWSRIVEALYDDCLITDGDVKNMVKASGTVRWTQRDEEGCGDTIARPGDRFRELRFTSTKTRSDAVGVVMQHRCISEFHVLTRQLDEPISFLVTESATEDVELNNKGQLAVLQKNLNEVLVVQHEVPELRLQAGWTLVSGNSIIGFSKADLRQALDGLRKFPARLVFEKTGIDFNVVQVNLLEKLEMPCRIHAVSFSTGLCEPELDPVQWKVEGLLDDWQPGHIATLQHLEGDLSCFNGKLCTLSACKKRRWLVRLEQGGHEIDVMCNNLLEGTGSPRPKWKQVVWQDTVYRPPLLRGVKLTVFFSVEYWRQRQPESEKVSNTVDLHNFLPVVSERLGFFTASLRGLLRGGEKYYIRPGIDTLLDSHVGNIPSLSQIIPVYSETVILSEDMLKLSDGVNTNLGFIISQFAEEWTNFSRKHNLEAEQLYHEFVDGKLSERLQSAERFGDSERAQWARNLIMEVRMWASMRSQTVARTVVGAIQYHEVLSMLPSVLTADDPAAALEHCVELVLSHQTYGVKGGKGSEKDSEDTDADVRYLLEKFSKYPFYLVFDYEDSEKKGVKKNIREAVKRFMQDHYSYDGHIRYASVLARHRKGYSRDGHRPPEDSLEIVEVLPRQYPLLVGDKSGFSTQGKAGNQLGALRFSRGAFLQMMDANMGSFLGEACKVPFVLRRFQPHYTSRMQVEARIIGFRETIFTADHGTVGAIMASAEWSFGTICQRFLAGLGARMHYGHPDFLDGFWASNRGSLSKASPAINLSEDIFAGFNVKMRGEKSKHVDSLAWEKGRESSFNAASLFFTKVSKGNVGVMRSRDLKIITESLNIVDNFSFYFASVGFYVNNLLIDFSLLIYVSVFILLTLSSKTLREVGLLDSMLATEWIFSLGIVSMFPRFMELTLEYGPLEGILKFLPSIPGCMMMFTFINKSISSGVSETIITGEASYIGTGRPNANTHYSWRECYFIYCRSHYYPALKILTCYLLYRLLSEEFMTSSLPMIVLLVSVCLWIVAPILFCPQPTLRSLTKDLSELWHFIIGTPDWSIRTLLDAHILQPTEAKLKTTLGDPMSNLYEFWLLDALQHKKLSRRLRLAVLAFNFFKFLLVLLVTYSSMIDNVWNVVVLFTFHFLLMELWRLLYRPTAIVIITMFMWILVPPIVWPHIAYVNLLTIFILCIWGLQVVTDVIQLVAWCYLRPNLNWQDMPETDNESSQRKKDMARRVIRYDMVVEYLYVNLLQHQLHLYSALAVLLLDLAVQSCILVFEMTFGIHSWFLLNGNLRSKGCCARREGYEPGRRSSTAAMSAQNVMREIMRFRPSFTGSLQAPGSGSFQREELPRAPTREVNKGQGHDRRPGVEYATEIPEVRRKTPPDATFEQLRSRPPRPPVGSSSRPPKPPADASYRTPLQNTF